MESQGSIGIFGGSFSPPHMGHVLACHYALSRWNLKRVMVIPSYKHPFGKYLPEFEMRLEMCRLAFQHLGDFVEVSDIERQMGGVSYTVDTLRELTGRHPAESFRLLVGGDILPDTKKWREFDELVKMSPLLVIPRITDGTVKGGEHLEAALPDVSSTQVREHLAQGGYPHGALPLKVLEYVKQHKLYDQPDSDTETELQ